MFVFSTARKRSRILDVLSIKIRFNQQQMLVWWVSLFFNQEVRKLLISSVFLITTCTTSGGGGFVWTRMKPVSFIKFAQH